MLTNDRERKICERYSKYDDKNKVHCFECPLRIAEYSNDFRCKANSHYDRHFREWVYDD